MISLQYIRENKDKVAKNIRNRGLEIDLDYFLDLDKKRADLLFTIEDRRAQKNKLKGKPTEKELTSLQKDKESLERLETEYRKIDEEFRLIYFSIPNMTHPDAPIGRDESGNKEIESLGKIRKFDFAPKDHLEIGESLGILDFEAGSKVAGNKFYYLKGDAVLLEQALISYTLDILKRKGFEIYQTPDIAKTEIVEKMGYQPRGEEKQIYNLEGENLSLIGTAEITLGGMLTDKIIDKKDLPLFLGGLSHCFRTEAGAYGKHSKGLYRVHQFTKVEMFIFCLPEESEKYHQKILTIEKEIYTTLGIPFRVVEMCSGDLGAVPSRKYDLEAWMPGKDGYGEITSASNCTDYQARNLQIRYRGDDKKTNYLHMLNGTAMAISRALIVILENYQKKDGSVEVPGVLQRYLGKKIIKKEKL